jgi:hypothetical protein
MYSIQKGMSLIKIILNNIHEAVADLMGLNDFHENDLKDEEM